MIYRPTLPLASRRGGFFCLGLGVALDLCGPAEKSQEITFFRHHEFPKFPCVERFGGDTGVGFNSPAKIGALPWLGPMASQRVPQETDWSEQMGHGWKADSSGSLLRGFTPKLKRFL